MNPFTSLIREMREKKLWPIALVLVVVLIAVPIVLSKSAAPVPVQPIQAPPSSGLSADVPSIAQQVNPIRSRLTQGRHNPFVQTKIVPFGPTGSSGKTVAVGATGTSGATGPAPATGSTGTSGSTTTTTPTTTTPTTTTPTTTGTGTGTTPTPPPPELTPTQVYDVTFSISNAQGGFSTIDSLQRLSPVPSTSHPLLVNLGVLKGGNKLVFAVEPQASVEGPGECIPSPTDCEVMTIAPGQVELLSGNTTGGMVFSEFSVTGISKRTLANAGAAAKARRDASADGRSLLNHLTGPVVKLFTYDPSQGFVTDHRNLTVGAS